MDALEQTRFRSIVAERQCASGGTSASALSGRARRTLWSSGPRNRLGNGGRAPASAEALPSLTNNVWRCPALPHPLGCSTIGAGSRNDRVRNGTGCATSALTTKQTLETTTRTPNHPHQTKPGRVRYRGVLPQNRIACVSITCIGSDRHNNERLSPRQLVPVYSTHYYASIPGLSTRSSPGRLTNQTADGDLISEHASRLDAFSGYRSRT
jgi:hypothetical protein